MVDFELTPEQKEFRERARRFAEDVIHPWAEKPNADPSEMINLLAEQKMIGAALPQEEGGSGQGHVAYVLALIEITKGSPSMGSVMFVNDSLYGQTLFEHARQEQRATYLRPCATGKGLGTVALNHPQLDPGQIALTASRTGGGWLLDGSLPLVGAGVSPTHCIVPAGIGEGEAREISLFALDLCGTPGLRLEKHAPDYPDSTLLVTESTLIPEDALLGETGEGLNFMIKSRAKNWIGSSAQSIGIGRAFVEKAVSCSIRKKRLGRSLFSSQAVQWALADMATALDAAELLTLKAAWLADQGKSFEKEAAMAKLYASDAAMKTALDATQILGEESFGQSHPLWALMKHAKKCQMEQENNLRMKGVITGHLVKDLKGTI